MTIESYRPTPEQGFSVRARSPHVHGFTVTEAIEAFVSLRELIPDTRLQAIADAWNEWKMEGTLTHEQLAMAVDEVLMQAARTEENNASVASENRKRPHIFRGKTDRWCTSCNLPDRNPIHVLGDSQ